MGDVKALLASARLAERSVDLCLRGDLVAQAQELQRQLIDAEALEKVHGSIDGGPTVPLAQAIEVLREEMKDHTLTVRLRAVPRRQWTALLAQHPPREGNDRDARLGLNEETFFDAAIRACVYEPELDEQDWAGLDAALNDGQWQTLANAAWAVNARDVDVPFSARASRILATSEHE